MNWIVTLTPDGDVDPFEKLRTPPPDADVVELRLDLFPELDVAAARAQCPLPILATLRSEVEGGQGPADPEARARVLRRARDAGAHLIDLEFRRDLPLIQTLGIDSNQLVASWHDVAETPHELHEIADEMLRTPARWVKVIPTANRLADLAAVVALHRRFNDRPRGARRLICFGMGRVGVATRYIAPLFGPNLSFAAWPGLSPAAPGQLTAASVDAVIGHLHGAPQLLFGVVGRDVTASLSPALHSAAYRALGLHHLFLPISVNDAEELPQLFDPGSGNIFHALGFSVGGWAVTTPFKTDAASYATRCAPRAERAGAANTILFRGAQVVAENTDADGVVGALATAAVDPRGLRATVLGAGGAGRGAAVGLHLAGADVCLCGRDPDAVRRVADEIGVDFATRPPATDILVNATPLGRSADDPSPFADRLLATAKVVVDMVYASHTTPLIVAARAQGTTAIDGRNVLAHQGFAQFAAMNATIPPREEMAAALGIDLSSR